MEGATDGTLISTGQKFFECMPGRGMYYPLVNVQPDVRFMDTAPVVHAESHPSASSGGASRQKLPHPYESPDQLRRAALHKQHQHNQSVQDDQMLGLPSDNKSAHLQHQRSMPAPDRHHDLSQDMGGFQPSDPQYAQYANLPLTDNAAVGRPTVPPHDPYQDKRQEYPPVTYGSNAPEPSYPPPQSQPSYAPERVHVHVPQSGDGGSSQGGISAFASEAHVSRSFLIGSTVQLSDPPHYGVVQWIGHLPEFQGLIAGLELVS